MGKNVRFSLIAPAIRSHLYRGFCDNLKNNKVPFEVIFVGNVPPKESMPSNFVYIESNVNCAQCWEIASRSAQGDYLFMVTDDCLFSDLFLDTMDYYINKVFMEDSLIGTRYQTNGIFWDNILRYRKRMPTSPVLPGICAFRRDIWSNIGGIDCRFLGGFCNVDMILRFYEHGLRLFITPDCWVNEIRNNPTLDEKNGMWAKTGSQGKKICDSFWIKDSIFSKKRLKPVISFKDEEILTKDQFLIDND